MAVQFRPTRSNNERYKMPAGRPTVMTPEVVSKLEQAFSMGCSDLEACLFADISKQALYDYQEKNPEFTDRKAMLKQKMIFKARSVIAEALNNKDENTAKWLLERKLKDEFSTKTESNINVNGEVALVKWK